MSTEQQWPQDIEFRKFAARVADAVMTARAYGFTVSNGIGKRSECCPLGAVCISDGQSTLRYPSTYPAAVAMRCGGDDAARFIEGFDGTGYDSDENPYYRLGREYRRRALGECKWGER